MWLVYQQELDVVGLQICSNTGRSHLFAFRLWVSRSHLTIIICFKLPRITDQPLLQSRIYTSAVGDSEHTSAMSSHLIQTTINATPTTLYTSTVATVSNISSSFANNSELAINIAFGVFASTAALITILMTWRQIRVVKSNTAPTQSVQMTAQNHSNCDGITLRSIEEGSAGKHHAISDTILSSNLGEVSSSHRTQHLSQESPTCLSTIHMRCLAHGTCTTRKMAG